MSEEEPGHFFVDFDRYCDEHNITDEEVPVAFAAFLNEYTGWDGPMSELPVEEDQP